MNAFDTDLATRCQRAIDIATIEDMRLALALLRWERDMVRSERVNTDIADLVDAIFAIAAIGGAT